MISLCQKCQNYSHTDAACVWCGYVVGAPIEKSEPIKVLDDSKELDEIIQKELIDPDVERAFGKSEEVDGKFVVHAENGTTVGELRKKLGLPEPTEEWLKKVADKEDNCITSVGGLLHADKWTTEELAGEVIKWQGRKAFDGPDELISGENKEPPVVGFMDYDGEIHINAEYPQYGIGLRDKIYKDWMKSKTREYEDSRRLRRYYLSKENVLSSVFFNLKSLPKMAYVLRGADIPESVEIVSVNFDWERRAFGFLLRHPSFDPVPEMEIPPNLIPNDVKWEAVRLGDPVQD